MATSPLSSSSSNKAVTAGMAATTKMTPRPTTPPLASPSATNSNAGVSATAPVTTSNNNSNNNRLNSPGPGGRNSTSSNSISSQNSNNNNGNHIGVSSPRDPTIRHAGRTHIRGKIRRVWRPRYLELCDSGLVRYYELPPTADVTLPEDSDWDHVHMIPKDSLVIYHARIIDVTTLRDLHVGLPRGSYGFLFRGQRIMDTKEYLLVHHPDPNPPRDYFCAVSTLEEAQTWVIALQWAATVGLELRRPTVNQVQRLECGYNPNNHNNSNSSTQQEEEEEQTNIGNDTVTRQQEQKAKLDETARATASSDMDNNGTKSTSSSSSTPRQTPGRIVVTKIQGFRIVQPDPLHWHVAYEIAVLLIQASKIEERRLLRTRKELSDMLDQLSKSSPSIDCKILETARRSLQAVPATFSSQADICKSFDAVDRLLRHLVLEASVVNSQALKRCLVLDHSTRLRIRPAPTWYQSYKLHANTIMSRPQVRSVVERDDYVRKWLKTKSKTTEASSSSPSSLLWMLQRPVVVFGIGGVGAAILPSVWNFYSRYMISVTLRLDMLILSWCLVGYIGRELMGSSSPLPSSRNSHVVSKRTRDRRSAKKVVSTPSTTSSTTPSNTTGASNAVVVEAGASDESAGDDEDDIDDEELLSEDGEEDLREAQQQSHRLSSPLPEYPANNGESCWSVPPDVSIFKVRGANYLQDRVKLPSGPSPFTCRGVDLWLTDNPERHIARHPSVLGGKLLSENKDTFLVNFLLPFGNFVSYFEIPPLSEFPERLANVWTKFLKGDQQYRDARLKLLPVVMEGPWIVKAAVGNGTAPALLGKVIPLQYFFKDREKDETNNKPGIYEVDVIITASSIAKGILSVVKGHTKSLTIAFAFIIEAATEEELPETVLCSLQVHALHLEDCPHLPECDLDELENDE